MDARGWNAVDTEFPLTIGRSYWVYGLAVYLGTIWYYVLNDDGNRWPLWEPSGLFEVEDGTIPASWIFGNYRFDRNEQYPILSFPEWAGDFSYYERLLDDEPEALEIFARRRLEAESV